MEQILYIQNLHSRNSQRAGPQGRVWLRELFLLSLEMAQSSADRNHQANIESWDRRIIHSSVFQHQLPQGNGNELVIPVQVGHTKNHSLQLVWTGEIPTASELPDVSHCKHTQFWLEKCVFQLTYHERPDHHIWHLGQLVVQQGSGCMICHLQHIKGERKYLYSLPISDKAVLTCRKTINSMGRWQTREWKDYSVSFPLKSGIN